MSSTTPGIPSALLLDLASRYGGEGSTLVLGGEAALTNEMDGEVAFLPTDIREQDTSRVSIVTNPEQEKFGTVLIPAPPDRDLLRRQLLIAGTAVKEGGRVLVCGANATGGKTAIKDAAEHFGEAVWSGYREKHRMAIFAKRELLSPSWANENGITPGTWQEFEIETPVGVLKLATQAGVFAGAKLDAGTRLLLEHLEVSGGSNVLDVGCGVGVIGITAARMGAASVTMTDANLLAVQAAAHNSKTLGIDADVNASDVYQHIGDRRFDLIVSNPPFHRGKQVDYSVANEIISGAAQRLNPGGRLVIVANAFLAYGKHMATVFTRVDTIAATPQYHVLRGEQT